PRGRGRLSQFRSLGVGRARCGASQRRAGSRAKAVTRWLLAIAIVITASTPAMACKTDSQCTAPDRCHFSTRESEGLCFDSSQMAVGRDERQKSRPLKERQGGDVCQFTVDCSVGMGCFKLPGAAEGKCYAPPR